MERSKERDILEYQPSCLHLSFPWSFLVKKLLPRDNKDMSYEIIVFHDGVSMFFLPLLARSIKHDSCAKSGSASGTFGHGQREGLFLSGLCCSVHTSSAPAPWLQPSAPY